MDKVKINLFGIGCRIVRGQFDENTWSLLHSVANEMKTPFHDAVFDNSYFDYLSDGKYKSWYDFGNMIDISGLMNSYQSIIEIRINGRKKTKFLSTT